MVEVQVDIVAVLADAAAFAHLHRHRAGDDVARRTVLGRWGIALHEELTLGVRQIAALAARSPGQANAGTIDAVGVELDESNVLKQKPSATPHAASVAGAVEGARPRQKVT